MWILKRRCHSVIAPATVVDISLSLPSLSLNFSLSVARSICPTRNRARSRYPPALSRRLPASGRVGSLNRNGPIVACRVFHSL